MLPWKNVIFIHFRLPKWFSVETFWCAETLLVFCSFPCFPGVSLEAGSDKCNALFFCDINTIKHNFSWATHFFLPGTQEKFGTILIPSVSETMIFRLCVENRTNRNINQQKNKDIKDMLGENRLPLTAILVL